MPEFKTVPLNITEYKPLHDTVLITLNTIDEKKEDIVASKMTSIILFVQTVKEVSERARELHGIKEGDQVFIDTTSITRDPDKLQEDIVFLNNDPEQKYLVVPTRFIKAIVKENSKIEIDNE